ncbi:methionine import ATP-binding protein MetN [Clostridia bacterium]|nr:methionine import ATP-binding protein MetN [Clostridia bacterium]
MIELRELTKTYKAGSNEVKALDGVSLTVDRADIFGVVGFSGAGKSTLIRCINLLERPDSGSVIIGGTDITAQTEKQLEKTRQKIGMIFQHFNLMRSKTVFENLALPLKYQKRSKRDIEIKVGEILNLVGLSDKRNNYPSQLSGGQKQRVAIARALANDPHILLSDESTSALDPQTTDSILELLQKLNKLLNLTIVIITHEMLVVKQICNKAAFMDKGRVVEQGDLFDMFSNPRTEATKKFTANAFDIEEVQKILRNIDIKSLTGENGKFLHLVFLGDGANDAHITKVARKFAVDISIIYGGIEIIQSRPIGNLFVVVQGTGDAVNAAIAHMRLTNTHVSVLSE